MDDIFYTGPFKSHIQNHIELKQAIGYKYDADAKHLKRFDRFVLDHYPNVLLLLPKKLCLTGAVKKLTKHKQINVLARQSSGNLLGIWILLD